MKMHKNTQRTVIFILVMTLLSGTFSFPALALDNYDFANFTEDDAMSFVEENNIEIPEIFSREDTFSTFTLELILQSYYSPNKKFNFNYSVTQEYAETIREAVRSCMNLAAVPAVASTSTYELQYNKVMNSEGAWVTSGGAWDSRWDGYNCYAYAINRIEKPNRYNDYMPEDQYQPGDICDQGFFNPSSPILDLAQLVEDDLSAMGYSNISLSSTMPTINASQELICVRQCTWDFHFMRYDLETNAWYHKPGNTAVLKYNYVPSNDRLWYMEYSLRGSESRATLDEVMWDRYDSDIMFITYSKNQVNIDRTGTSWTAEIQPEKDICYELDFNTVERYGLTLSSSEFFSFYLYDEDFNQIMHGTSGENPSNAVHPFSICTYFDITEEKYFLMVYFLFCDELDTVNIEVIAYNCLIADKQIFQPPSNEVLLCYR